MATGHTPPGRGEGGQGGGLARWGYASPTAVRNPGVAGAEAGRGLGSAVGTVRNAGIIKRRLRTRVCAGPHAPWVRRGGPPGPTPPAPANPQPREPLARPGTGPRIGHGGREPGAPGGALWCTARAAGNAGICRAFCLLSAPRVRLPYERLVDLFMRGIRKTCTLVHCYTSKPPAAVTRMPVQTRRPFDLRSSQPCSRSPAAKFFACSGRRPSVSQNAS